MTFCASNIMLYALQPIFNWDYSTPMLTCLPPHHSFHRVLGRKPPPPPKMSVPIAPLTQQLPDFLACPGIEKMVKDWRERNIIPSELSSYLHYVRSVREVWKYLGAKHANRACFLIRKILTFTFILLHSLLTYFSSHTPHFRYLCSISSLHSHLYLHHLSLL